MWDPTARKWFVDVNTWQLLPVLVRGLVTRRRTSIVSERSLAPSELSILGCAKPEAMSGTTPEPARVMKVRAAWPTCIVVSNSASLHVHAM